jgi:hypothetical protein
MRSTITLFAFATSFTTSLAFADEPAPEAPKPEEPKPADPAPSPDKPVDPPKAEPPKEEPPKPGVNIPSTTAPTATTSTVPVFDDHGGVHGASDPTARKPKIAVELSMTSGRLADPFVIYKGYTLENGQAIGTRIEGNLLGISLSYELATMSNTQACSGDACFGGDFGRTTINVLELGYRFRFSKIGPVRPYLHAGIGGVLANIGGWSMTSSKTIKGGEARGAFGVEIPVMKRFFASAGIAYRFIVVENGLRNEDADRADKIFVNGTKPPNGDYADDAHLITGYVGFGVTL